MRTPLWTPSEAYKRQANITRFIEAVNQKHKTNFASYAELYEWSVTHIPDFWAEVWNFSGIIASRTTDRVVTDLNKFPGADWFPGARLNFAENLLRHRDEQLAFIFIGETQKSRRMTYAELYDSVAKLSHSLKEASVGVGDRVVGYMPNMIETVIGMLA